MPWTFNPFSGTFDQKGSGGGGGGSAFFSGEVATYADLPLDGTAALNSRWLVRNSSGTWPFPNYRQGGIYIRTSIIGSSRDNDYTLADTKLPDVFADSAFLLYDNSDSTRNLQFDLGSITTGTVRTLTAPNASGRIQVEGQPIGNTTPAAGTFTTLTANNGTLTGASAPVLDLAQTWNNASTVFTALRLNITNTASSGSSLLIDASVGSNYFRVNRAGQIQIDVGSSTADAMVVAQGRIGTQNGIVSANFHTVLDVGGLNLANARSITWSSTGSYGGAGDLFLRRDAAGVLAQYNAANPQEYRIYNTFTSATNHERGFLRWSSNVFQIGTEKGSGGGTGRNLEFILDGTSVATMEPSGYFGNANVGIHFRQTGSGNRFSITSQGQVRLLHNNSILLNESSGGYGWVVSGAPTSLGFDTGLFRDAAGVVAIRNGTNAQAFRLYNTVSGTNNVNFERLNFRWASNEFILDAEAGGTGTSLRGIKIGSATSSLLGFYGVTPVDQPATVADPAGGGTVDTEARTAINAIIDRLQELGLIA